MKRDERPLGAVPAAVWLGLGAALAAQLAWHAARAPLTVEASDLPAPPAAAALRLAAFGEPEALARLAMLYVQSFDLRAGNSLPYRRLDYARLKEWLATILSLDPRSEYPLFAAARVYAEVEDPARCRTMLEFVYQQFLRDPNRRWPEMAHAALVAKHRLNDLPLARRYAAAVQRDTTDPTVPLWAKQMEIFILEDMNELEAAKIMLGGLLESGAVRDADEARFLAQHLKALEDRGNRSPGK